MCGVGVQFTLEPHCKHLGKGLLKLGPHSPVTGGALTGMCASLRAAQSHKAHIHTRSNDVSVQVLSCASVEGLPLVDCEHGIRGCHAHQHCWYEVCALAQLPLQPGERHREGKVGHGLQELLGAALATCSSVFKKDSKLCGPGKVQLRNAGDQKLKHLSCISKEACMHTGCQGWPPEISTAMAPGVSTGSVLTNCECRSPLRRRRQTQRPGRDGSVLSAG